MKHLKKAVVLLCLGALLTGCGRFAYKSGVQKLEDKKYEEAVGEFEEAIEAGESVGDSWRGIGIARWETEDYEGAKEAFETALKEGAEEDVSIYQFLGSCSMKLEDYEGAADYYKKGIALGDSGSESVQEMRFNLIAAYEKLGDYDSAKEELATYTTDYPDDEKAAKEAEFLETR